MASRRRPTAIAAPATPRALAALWRPAVASRAATGPASGVEAVDLEHRRVRVRRGDPAEQRVRRSGGRRGTARRSPSRSRPRAGAPRRRARSRRSGPASRRGAPRAPRRPSSATFATSTGGVPGPPGPSAPPARRIQASNAASTASRSANTSGWSHSAEVRTATAGRYGSKLPAYSSASTTNGVPGSCARGGRSPATPMPVSDAGSSAPTNAAGVHAARGEHVDEPAGRRCSCRASRRPRRACVPRPRPRPPAARARAGCRRPARRRAPRCRGRSP